MQESDSEIHRETNWDGFFGTLIKYSDSEVKEIMDRFERYKLKKNEFSGKPLTNVTDKTVQKLERGCAAIRKMITKTNLNHLERTFLLFNYMLLGDKGEARLRQILQRQTNYNRSITDAQIRLYKRKGKFVGVSCEKAKEWGICNEDCYGPKTN